MWWRSHAGVIDELKCELAVHYYVKFHIQVVEGNRLTNEENVRFVVLHYQDVPGIRFVVLFRLGW